MCWLWNLRFDTKHPVLSQCADEPETLRLILGLGRSGTTWMSRTLASTRSRIRYVEEPFIRFVPHLLSRSRYCGLPYRAELPRGHDLFRALRAFTLPDCHGAYRNLWEEGWADFHLKRADTDWRFVLLKEVHAILVAEAMIRAFRCPILLVLRDPVYMTDSLFHRDGLNSVYLAYEDRQVLKTKFLERFAKDYAKAVQSTIKGMTMVHDERRRAILRRVITIGLIQKMFVVLASEYQTVQLVRYEELCYNPEAMFPKCAAWLGLAWDETCDELLEATCRGKPTREALERISRKSADHIRRPFHFLTAEEVDMCRRALDYCGLAGESRGVAQSDGPRALFATEGK